MSPRLRGYSKSRRATIVREQSTQLFKDKDCSPKDKHQACENINPHKIFIDHIGSPMSI